MMLQSWQCGIHHELSSISVKGERYMQHSPFWSIACSLGPALPRPYVPSALCYLSTVFPQPYVPSDLCSLNPMVPQPYVPSVLCSLSPMFPRSCVSSALYYLSPMFPQPYVPSAVCSLRRMLPQPYITSALCSLSPMFPQPYVPSALCFIGPILTALYFLNPMLLQPKLPKTHVPSANNYYLRPIIFLQRTLLQNYIPSAPCSLRFLFVQSSAENTAMWYKWHIKWTTTFNGVFYLKYIIIIISRLTERKVWFSPS